MFSPTEGIGSFATKSRPGHFPAHRSPCETLAHVALALLRAPGELLSFETQAGTPPCCRMVCGVCVTASSKTTFENPMVEIPLPSPPRHQMVSLQWTVRQEAFQVEIAEGGRRYSSE